MSREPDDLDRILEMLKRDGNTQQVSDKKLSRLIRRVTGYSLPSMIGQVKSSLKMMDFAMPKKTDGDGNPTVWWVDPEGESVSNMVAEIESDEVLGALEESEPDDGDEDEEEGSD